MGFEKIRYKIAFKENKFNTAKNNINNAQININSAKKIILKENNTNRDYDFTAIILSLSFKVTSYLSTVFHSPF